MMDRVRAFLSGLSSPGETAHAFDDKEMAAAALLIEVAAMDGRLDPAEEAAIRRALEKAFALQDDEVDALLAAARERAGRTTQLFGFTRAFKDNSSYAERVALIELLWEVALADGRIDHYESNLLRRVGGLLYVSDRDRGEARKRVESRHRGAATR